MPASDVTLSGVFVNCEAGLDTGGYYTQLKSEIEAAQSAEGEGCGAVKDPIYLDGQPIDSFMCFIVYK
jgi:hypothetical protein